MDTRIPISFERAYGALSRLLGLRPEASYLELAGEEVRAQMGWAFRARFPRSAVSGAQEHTRLTLSRGVHGWGGRWLVNGSGQGLVSLRLQPAQRAYVLGFPVKLEELIVSVAEPAALVELLKR